jgi:shikimate dehydrogenase
MTESSERHLYGLIGYPVKHSYSAFMHNAAFAHRGIPAQYHLFEVEPHKLDEFFKKTIPQKGIKGFNVTVPLKEKACEYLDGIVDLTVKMAGAVNTVRVEEDGSISGFNTDSEGFARDLECLNVAPGGKRLVLLGAGGGARAVAAALARSKPSVLRLFDIDQDKAIRLARHVQECFRVDLEVASSMDDLEVRQADILVNATPVGMKEADPLLIKREWLHPGLFVYDLIYNPQETKLLKACRAAGVKCANGLGMLLYQGCLAFEHWTGQAAPVDVMRQALEKGGLCRK